MDRLLNVIAAISGVLIALVLVSVRRAHIRVEYSVSWLLAATALLVLSRSRTVLESVAGYLGISNATPMALVLVIGCVFLIMFFRFSVIVSRLRDDNIALAQKVAILEYHIHTLQDQANRPTLS